MTNDTPNSECNRGNSRSTALVGEVFDIERVVKRRLGRGLYVYEMDFLDDSRVVAYLGVVTPRDTTPWPSDAEISFVNYAPFGAAIATPTDEGYRIELPDRDNLHAAMQARIEYENEQRASIIPSLLNLLDDRQKMHFEEAGEYGFHEIEDSLDELDLDGTEWFHLGRAVGMYKMASLAERSLRRRLETPIDGHRRWRSREYDVVRGRRTADVLEVSDED